MCPQGVYPVADVCTIGDEISSTYESRHIALYADNLEHGSELTKVKKGYPIYFSEAVGIPFIDQPAIGDNPLIAVDTEGIWCVDVLAENDGGGDAVIPGDALYINTTTNLVSKIRDNATQLPFGYALGNVGSGLTESIAVKVHWDPLCHWLEDAEMLYFGDGRDVSIDWNEIFLAMAIAAASKAWGIELAITAAALADGYGFIETNANVSGAATGYVAARSDWVNLAADFEVMAGGGLITPHTDGIYEAAGAEIAGATIALIGKFTDQMPDGDFGMYNLWNLNLTQELTALFEVNNPALMGYAATPATVTVGSIPFFHTGGGATKYIMLYSNPA